jgi:hypothetical protein
MVRVAARFAIVSVVVIMKSIFNFKAA